MNTESFKKQFLPFHPKLYRIAFALVENKEDAEDILQEVYCKLWNKRDELTDIANPEAFAITVTKNLSLDFLRSAQVVHRRETIEEVAVAADEASPYKSFEKQDELNLVKQLIDRLPDKQRQVIRLRGLSDCTLEEIEDITGFTAVNVRTLLSRARKIIREQYEKIYAI